MATATSDYDPRYQKVVQDLAAGQRRVRRQEAVLGLLFVAPAAVAMFVFGLFPVLYGFAISLQGGTILPQGFVGLNNFASAIGSLAYILAIAIGIVLAILGYSFFRTPYNEMRAGQPNFYLYLIPAFLAAPATLLLLGLAFSGNLSYAGGPLLTLLVAAGMYAFLQIRARASLNYVVNSWGMATLILSSITLMLYTFSEMQNIMLPAFDILSKAVSFNKYIVPPSMQFQAFLGAATGVIAVYWIGHARGLLNTGETPSRASAVLGIVRWVVIVIVVLLTLYLIGSVEMLRATLNAFGRVAADKLATLTPLKADKIIQQATLWSQVFTIILGSALIGIAFTIWQGATRHATTLGMLSMLGVAILLMVGGWLFIGELPVAAASGDPEFYSSILRTVTYAVLTVPFQLGIGLALAYLLFYEVRWGKSFFRIVYFMPYIAPTVATAAVFVVMFSLRDESPANQFMHMLGLPSQEWLRTPNGVFEIIAKIIGGRNAQVPSMLVGPSLPLVSAIIFSIWVFSGYNCVIFMAGLGGVPKELYEAAQVDGAGRWAAFRNITIPMISPTTFFLTILAIIGTFKAFTHIWVLRGIDTRGAMDTATVYIFQRINGGATTGTSFPYAASLSFILFGIIVILTLVQNRLSRDQVFYG